ncbi:MULTISPECIES: BON domain-containing protein [unclassified Halomonas]|uniref:BON domain-containing protein n=1 Tax=unclassified Halomonas TaxID=2609666 RepID=UPI0007F0C3A2|nr:MULTISPECIES: BON domain-containing protein [unclassified Halomonas]SBR51569.1 Osmotically-inducible protein OsmY, contains BON domain [Halomonas sp. HL-93]SNY97412.1 Osmotically-inducible protein OsmY, contains BON domain [Halomonas sp. hl-4]
MLKSDAQIQKDVLAELGWEPSVRASDIGVEVKGGIVTLAGHVDSYAEKWHAETAAQRVSGVKGVAIEIDVKLPGNAKRTDADIARAVKNTLEWNIFVPNDPLKVMVENGWVTLSGMVPWDYQRRLAETSIRYLAGVVGVSNQIVIKPNLSAAAVRVDIENSLKRKAIQDANAIKVEVHDHDVKISGKVDSLVERDLINHAVWNSPGVWTVTDNIRT